MAEEKPRETHIGEEIFSGSIPGGCRAVRPRSQHVLLLWPRGLLGSDVPGTNPSDGFHSANSLEAEEAAEEGEGKILSSNPGH